MQETPLQTSETKKSCTNCGTELIYAPGTTALKCEYCGHEETIIPSNSAFEELALKKYLSQMGSQSYSETITLLHCDTCGANQHVDENYKSLHCVYCSTPLIVNDAYKEDWILPGAVLPFQIDKNAAHQIFKKWVKSLWFVPNKLHKASLSPENTKGLYVPYWTFDAKLKGEYTGQRGDYYYVSVPHTVTKNGKSVQRTRQERRTRWSYASGRVEGFVDDTLVKASHQSSGRIPSKIASWNLDELQPFDNSFLSGFITEKYTIPLKEGHNAANKIAHSIATRWAKRDIGGDTQRVDHLNLSFFDETFKHILLPVYISNYAYNNKKYRFFINGQTGTISGERPYSFWKIFFLVLGIIAAIILIVFLTK